MQYFEDFAVGQKFASDRLAVSAAEIKEFAARYDPQPFHLDETAAKETSFAGLAASGWHTAALTMRLIVRQRILAGWRHPRLWRRAHLQRGRCGRATSCMSNAENPRNAAVAMRPGQGIVKLRVTTLNQDGEVVQTFTPALLVPLRPA